MDFREPKNRTEAFIKWFSWSVEYKDADTSIWLANYLNSRYEHNSEQRFWFAWLFANCYNLPTAWILMNEFPDYELANQDRVFSWNNANYSRLRYETDMKYEKGKLPKKLESYRKTIGLSQEDFFRSLLGDNEKDSFKAVWNAVHDNFYGFGRYSTWFYTQQLKHTCNLEIDTPTLMLSDFSGSKAHRTGLLYAVGQDANIDKKLTPAEYLSLEDQATDILTEVKLRLPTNSHEIDRFVMETCLCSFQKIFRNHKTRWLGYYHARQAENIQKVEGDCWTGIDWSVLWQARSEILDTRVLNLRLDSVKENDFLTSGSILKPWERTNNSLESFY